MEPKWRQIRFQEASAAELTIFEKVWFRVGETAGFRVWRPLKSTKIGEKNESETSWEPWSILRAIWEAKWREKE
jgi:hypothetical protein